MVDLPSIHLQRYNLLDKFKRQKFYFFDLPNQITWFGWGDPRLIEIMDTTGEVQACLAGREMKWVHNQETSKLKDLEELTLLCQDYDHQFSRRSGGVNFQIIRAIARLSFPLGLSTEAKSYRTRYLKRYRKRAIDLLIENDFSDPFYRISEILISRFNIDYAIEKVYQTENTELQAFLLNYKRNELKIDRVSPQSYELKPVDPKAFREIQKNWGLADLSQPELTLAGYRGEEMPVLIFPEFAGKKPITKVGYKFKTNGDYFSHYSDLEIIIPEGYKEMAYRAFSFHSGLKKITLPDSMVDIGEGAFKNSVLENVSLGKNLPIIKERTFSRCKNLKTITIPNSVKIIGKLAFSACESLEFVVLGEKVERIESRAFAKCVNLKAINLPASLKYIDRNAFLGSGVDEFSIDDRNPNYYVEKGALFDKNTKEVLIYPQNKSKKYSLEDPRQNYLNFFKLFQEKWMIQQINGSEFLLVGYKGEKNSPLTLPENTEEIRIIRVGRFKCTYSEQIEELIIPEGYLSIDYYAFAYLRFKKVSLPDSLVSLGREAFKNCRDLEEIELGKGLQEIEPETFLGCVALKEIQIPDSVTVIKRRAFEGCQGLPEIKFGKSLEKLEDYAFAKCQNLKKIKLNPNLREISPSAFYKSGIIHMEIDDTNPFFYIKDGALFNQKTHELVIKFHANQSKR